MAWIQRSNGQRCQGLLQRSAPLARIDLRVDALILSLLRLFCVKTYRGGRVTYEISRASINFDPSGRTTSEAFAQVADRRAWDSKMKTSSMGYTTRLDIFMNQGARPVRFRSSSSFSWLAPFVVEGNAFRRSPGHKAKSSTASMQFQRNASISGSCLIPTPSAR